MIPGEKRMGDENMRKILALLMALCLAMAAIPAAAEGDVSGNWYLVMVGMTAFSIDLKTDGTCSMTVFSNEGEQSGEGTWTQDGDKISLTIEGNTLPLMYDGTNLQLDAEGIAALGLDSAMGTSGMDASMLSGLIQISREPGKITATEFNAYQKDGTLPEGKTEADMQTIQAEMMAAVFLLLGSANTGSGSTGSREEEPAPELTVVEENFYVRESYSGQEGVYIAKVQNNSETPAYLSDGSLILRDADGNEVGKVEYMRTTGSRYLDPGEITFVSLVADVEAGASVEGYSAELQSSAITYQTQDTALEISASELRKEEDYFTNYYATATITNNLDKPQSRISAILAVRASDGKLVDLNSASIYQNELGAGSTITLVDSVDSRAVEYCTKNNLTPDQVEAYAWIDAY